MTRLAPISVVASAAPPELQTRMDVAGFVGFARTGPVDVPVPIGDLARYEEVFGRPVPLLRDDAGGRLVTGYLYDAVAAFFANGGRSCWVVRVTSRTKGEPGRPAAARALFPVPGLVERDGEGAPRQALFPARAVGSWADTVTVGAGAILKPIGVADVSVDSVDATGQHGPRVRARLTRGSASPRDLLRLTFNGFELQCAVTVVAGAELVADSPLLLAPLMSDAPSAGSPLVGRTDGGIAVEILLAAQRVTLHAGIASAPRAGGVLRCDLDDGRRLLALIGDVRATTDAGRTELSAQVYEVQALFGPFSSTLQPLSAAVLTLELRTRVGAGGLRVVSDLGLVPGHRRYAGDLPTDEQLYALQPPGATVPSPDPLRDEVTRPRFELAGPPEWVPGSWPVLYPIGLPLPTIASARVGDSMPFSGPVPDPRTTLVRDGLATFGADLFLDPALASAGSAALPGLIESIRDTGDAPRPLVGVHALLAVDDVTLCAIPDAVHNGWEPGVQAADPEPPAHVTYTGPVVDSHQTPTETGGFADAEVSAIPAPALTLLQLDSLGTVQIRWSPAGSTSVLQELAGVSGWDQAIEVYRGPAAERTLYGRPPGSYAYRVRVESSGASSDWSPGLVVTVPDPAGLRPSSAAGSGLDPTRADLHAALMIACSARGDMFAALSVPVHWSADRASVHAASLRARLDDRTASFGALYHPWVLDISGRPMPPDGAIVGQLAELALRRGAWLVPGNRPLTAVVGVSHPAPAKDDLEQLLARVNVLRSRPRGVLAASAQTLSLDPDLGEIAVRRLLCLLRRMAARYGPEFVFEIDDDVLHRHIRRRFEGLLDGLLTRGALAGATPAAAYQVVVDSTPRGVVVQLKVAPSLPLRFLTVVLVGAGDGSVAVEGG